MQKTYDLSNFGKWLKRELAERWMTQRELAEKLETDEVSVSRYVNNSRMPRWKTVEKILSIFDSHAEILPNKKMFAEIQLESKGTIWRYVCGECHEEIDCVDSFCKHCGSQLIRPLER